MDIDVRAWLEALGLGAYAAAFDENFVDGAVLPHLTGDDLKEMGVAAVGHRRRLLEGIAALRDAERPPKPGPAAAPEIATAPQPVGERRQVTVLFSDICGFTQLSASLDSEEVHQILAAYFERADGIIRDHGGSVDKHVGDSVMAVFGAPVSHGNDADRAVRAAIAIQAAMPEISERIGRRLDAHIGIASGQVVASGIGPDTHYTVIGDSVNLAARLTDQATAGQIVVSSGVLNSVSGALASTDLGEIAVKGLAAPVRIHAVHGTLAPSDVRDDCPFVGRRAETRQFAGALELCQDAGRGQILLIRGDAGIGKTRLTDEFCRIASGRGFACHRSLILDFGVGKGQDPVRMLVRSLLELPAGEDRAARSAAAERAVAEGIVAPENGVHLHDLLDLPQSPENKALYDAMDNLTRSAGKRETVAALASNLSARRPRVIVFEDLHWADDLVLAHIAELGRGAAEAPMLIVMTSRIEGDPLGPAWRGSVTGTPFMTVDLGPLSRSDAMGMAARYVDAAGRVAQSCIERAAGNPLFLEQLLRSAGEAGDARVPGSVRSIVQARLDRLRPADRAALQAASVLGQRFSLPALRHLLDDARYDCAALVDHRFVRRQGEDFLFAHALVRDGVYGSLLRSRRSALHLAAAEWFASGDLPLRAEHLEQAGHAGAAEAFRAAAQAQASALRLEHALRLAQRGLAAASEPATRFALNCMLGELLRELGEPNRSIEACREALSQAGDETERCRALLGIAEALRIVERTDEALGLLDEAQPVAEAGRLTEILMRLHHLRGNLLFPKGDIAGCEAGHRQSIGLAREIGSAEGEARGLGGLGDAAYVAGRMQTAHDMLSGCVEICRRHGYVRTEVANAAQVCHTMIYRLELRAALELGRNTIEAARRVGHDRAELNAAAACLFATVELGDWSDAERHGDHVRELGTRLGSLRFSQEAMAFCGMMLKAVGRPDEALSAVREAIAAARGLGLAFGGPRMLGMLARISEDHGEQDRALAEAEAVIEGGCVGHNQLYFYRDAIEVMLDRQDWDGVCNYADALAAFARGEPLPWSEFFVVRARALADRARGLRDGETTATLTRLREDARRLGLSSALAAFDRAL